METYKFRCSLVGHEKDVRTVCSYNYPENSIISGSRDVTTRIWIPNGDREGFLEGNVMSGHSRFVSSVCVSPPDDNYPQGLIYTGSNDHTILAYTLESPAPVFKLEGHSDAVVSLVSGKFGSLVSGSWDKTARVWLNKKCVMTLQGHEAAVWAVAIMPEGGFMLSASADKTIKLWKAGNCEVTFRGHADCVRGLAVISVSEFLSCANDTSIKRWSTMGDCLQTFHGHTSFIYSIVAFPKAPNCFVTTSEDRSLKIWQDGECKQTIFHPCVSVWCACVLDNGDIVTGGSDGIVRVFTTAQERMAGEEEQKAYEEQVGGSSIPAQIGDIKTEELPPATALLNPGKRDGQTMMVRNGDQIEAHNWNASEGRWVKLGNVVGGAGGSQTTSGGKQIYNGKEYDYVFDVELDVEGVPKKLKLPFNAGGDPWLAAHNFLDENQISQMYLDQVAKFIMDQTKGMTIDQAGPPMASDPFTGGGRYIPGTAPPPQGASAGTASNQPDPFTGGGRYVPTYGNPQTQQNSADSLKVTFVKGQGDGSAYFPQINFLTFDSANVSAIIGKLKQLKAAAGSGASDEDLDQLAALASGESCSEQQLSILQAALQWPQEQVFPALDILRLSVKHEQANKHFCHGSDGGKQFLDFLLSFFSPTNSIAANSMLSLRTLTNLFSQEAGHQLMISRRDDVIAAILSCIQSGKSNKNIEIGGTTVLLNYAVSVALKSDVEASSQFICACAEICARITDPEAHFRLLVALGTLLKKDEQARELAKSMQMSGYVTKCAAIFNPKKVGECAEALSKLL